MRESKLSSMRGRPRLVLNAAHDLVVHMRGPLPYNETRYGERIISTDQ